MHGDYLQGLFKQTAGSHLQSFWLLNLGSAWGLGPKNFPSDASVALLVMIIGTVRITGLQE